MNVKDDAMTETPAPAARSHSRIGIMLLACVLIVAIAVLAWIRLRVDSGEALVPTADLSTEALDRRLLIAEQQVARLEQERAALQQRLQGVQFTAGNRARIGFDAAVRGQFAGNGLPQCQPLRILQAVDGGGG